VVELKQFCVGQGNGSGVPPPDRFRAVTARVSGMRKAGSAESLVLRLCGFSGIRTCGAASMH